MGYITLNNISLPVTNITEDPQIRTNVSNFVTGNGSKVTHNGNSGRKLDLNIHATNKNIQEIRGLRNITTPMVLVSPSKSDYNGTYYITGYNQTEDKKGKWVVTINLIEYTPFNVVKINFTDNLIIPTRIDNIKIGTKLVLQ